MTNADSSTKAARIIGKPFEKGKSGNPGGKKPMSQEVKEMLEAATPKAVKLLVDTLDDETKDMKLRIDCSKEILDRSLGRSKQSIDADINGAIPIRIVDDIK